MLDFRSCAAGARAGQVRGGPVPGCGVRLLLKRVRVLLIARPSLLSLPRPLSPLPASPPSVSLPIALSESQRQEREGPPPPDSTASADADGRDLHRLDAPRPDPWPPLRSRSRTAPPQRSPSRWNYAGGGGAVLDRERRGHPSFVCRDASSHRDASASPTARGGATAAAASHRSFRMPSCIFSTQDGGCGVRDAHIACCQAGAISWRRVCRQTLHEHGLMLWN
ncbi:hypothetical protein BRADI_5g01487v3 [Brachypodium distachyon]|uniref:Uncharacterized protein n=1 Tax=Brachypodium distachyon TaxID=15368 RepID=A0A2K2CEU8_BRADI|nr:hypothetical protein BRADI_5g01487v3 [Brachypodium distachyon]